MLQKAAWKSELRQLEESVQTTLKEIVAKALLSDPEEFLLTTVIQQGKNPEDHDIEGSAAIDFMMLAASQGQIVVRSYDAATGDSKIIQNKINESG